MEDKEIEELINDITAFCQDGDNRKVFINKLKCIKQRINTNNELKELYTKKYVENGIQKELEERYKSKRKNFSYPMFMQCWDDYFCAEKKILFVGRDPNTWYLDQIFGEDVPCKVNRNGDFSLENILKCYYDYNLGIGSNKHKGLIEFLRVVNNKIKGPLYHDYLYTNINKLGKRNDSGPCNTRALFEITTTLNNILIDEIKIIKPDFVFFLTEYKKKSMVEDIAKVLSLDTNTTTPPFILLKNDMEQLDYPQILIINNHEHINAKMYVFPHPCKIHYKDYTRYAQIIRDLIRKS